jgi:hypothetical protein
MAARRQADTRLRLVRLTLRRGRTLAAAALVTGFPGVLLRLLMSGSFLETGAQALVCCGEGADEADAGYQARTCGRAVAALIWVDVDPGRAGRG